MALYVVRPGVGETYDHLLDKVIEASGIASWVWRAGDEPMPDLPRRSGRLPPPPPAVSGGHPPSSGENFDPFAQSDPAGVA
jgi:hypothetical protein